MISDIWRITKTLVTLADDLQKYHSEIKEIRQEIRDLTTAVLLLKQRIEHNEELSDLAQDKLLLEVEKRLQNLDRRLPAKGESSKKTSRKGSKK